MGPATSTTASNHEGWNIIPEVSTASNYLRENNSWHHVIKCRAVVEYGNEVKSHANTHTHTHTHTKLNRGNYNICNNWKQARHYQGQHKKTGIYYCIHQMLGHMYVTFVLWLFHIFCVHSLPWLTTRCLSSLFVLENSLPNMPSYHETTMWILCWYIQWTCACESVVCYICWLVKNKQ